MKFERNNTETPFLTSVNFVLGRPCLGLAGLLPLFSGVPREEMSKVKKCRRWENFLLGPQISWDLSSPGMSAFLGEFLPGP